MHVPLPATILQLSFPHALMHLFYKLHDVGELKESLFEFCLSQSVSQSSGK